MAFEFDASTAKPDDGAFDPTTAKIEKPSAARRLGDIGISVAKGIIGVPEAAVGLADLVTGGQAGKAAEGLGFRPKEAKAILSDYYSPQQKAANAAVDQADGFIPTLGAMVQNPSTIVNTVAESAPSMLGGGAIGRGILKVAPKIGGVGAAAVGEGVLGAGQGAEQMRQETSDGLLTGTQAAIGAGSGALTGLIGYGAGRLANKLGIGDIDTQIATGKMGAGTTNKGLIRKTAEGVLTEGVLEEMPQSAQEQISQNIALGKQWDEGVGKSMAQGLLAGGFMGAGGAAAGHFAKESPQNTPPEAAPVEPVQPEIQPTPVIQPTQSEQMGIDRTAGPLSKAAADAVDTGVHAQTIAASIPGNSPAQMYADQGQNPLQSALQANNIAPDLIANEAINTPATAENAPTFGSAYAQRQATAPKIEPTDILNTDGKPFLTGFTAKKAATDAGEGFRPFKIAEKQYVVRQFAPETATNNIAAQAANTPATPEIEAQNAPKAEAIEAGTPAGTAGAQPAATDTPTRTSPLETTGIVSQPKENDVTETAKTVQAEQKGQTPTPPKSINAVPYEDKPTAIDGASNRPATGSGSTVPAGVVLPERSGSDLQARPAAVSQDAEKASISEAAHTAATSPKNNLPEPTQAQKEAGNYKKGHVALHGMDISIENPVGSTRSGTDAKGKKWSNTMRHHYGYIKGTVGMDKDHVDTFIGDKPESTKVFVVDQIDPRTGKADEHKIMLGFDSLEAAQKAYQSNYAKDWTGGKSVTETTVDGFKTWLKEGDTRKPFATQKIATEATNTPASGTIEAGKPVPAGLAKMREAKDKKEAESSAPEAIARQIQVKIAANRRAAQEKSRLANTAKGLATNTTAEKEQAGYDKEVAMELPAGYLDTAKAITEKNVPALIQKFVNGSFEASEDVFHKVTGVKVKGLSAANKKAALYKWANWTPEQIAAQEKAITNNQEARSAKFKADELKSNVKYAWNDLARLNAKLQTGESVTGQEFIRQQIAKGFDEVGTQKKGVATLYGLANGTKFTTIKHKTFTTFLKAARDYGGLKQALELVNPPAKESDNIASDFAPPKQSAQQRKDEVVLAQMEVPSYGSEYSKTILAEAQKTKVLPRSVIVKDGQVVESGGTVKNIETFADFRSAIMGQFRNVTGVLGGDLVSKPQDDVEKAAEKLRDDAEATNLLSEDQKLRLAGSTLAKYLEDTAVSAGVTNAKTLEAFMRGGMLNGEPFYGYIDSAAKLQKGLFGDDAYTLVKNKSVKLKDLILDRAASYLNKKVGSLNYATADYKKIFAYIESQAKSDVINESIAEPVKTPENVTNYNYSLRNGDDGFYVDFADKNMAQAGSWGDSKDAAINRAKHTIDTHKNSPYLKKRWDSPNGVVVDIVFASAPNIGELNERYEIEYADGKKFVYRRPEMDRVITRDEFNATAEGKAAAQKATENFNKEQARIKELADSKKKDDARIEAMADEWLATTDLSSLQKGAAKAALSKKFLYEQFDRKLMTRMEWVAKNIEIGSTTSVEDVPKYKGMTRLQYNRATNEEQEASDKRVRDGGTVKEYAIGNQVLTKFEYDYANFLLSKKQDQKPDKKPPVAGESIAEAATKTVAKIEDSGKGVAMFSRATQPGNWYSELGRQVLANKSSAMPAGMWAGWIESLKTKGVKPDEIEWSGVQDWLKLQTGKVTKADLSNYLSQNGVQVQETVLQDASNKLTESEVEDIESDIQYQKSNLDEELTESQRAGVLREIATLEQKLEKNSQESNTRYSQYQLPGGENYREVLLTLPTTDAKNIARRAELSAIDRERKLTISEQIEYDGLKDFAKGGNAYRSSHWEQPNVLAHIRVNDRTDADGKRVLFVEEIQSDWGQDGKKKGFLKSKITELPTDYKVVQRENSWAVKDAENKLMGAGDSEQAAVDRALEYINATNAHNGVPVAPFVTATDKWLSLALKRVVKMAVDGGYDKVAFVNGEQSADRYDLSKQVDSIAYYKTGDDYYISVMPSVAKGVYSELELENLIGKEMTRRIVETATTERQVLSGDDLKVGGEGMKAFYDKIVPNTAKEVIRKLGGGQMESVGLGRVEKGVLMSDRLYLSQPGFTITEAMREKAAGGVALFSRDNNTAGLPTTQVKSITDTIKARWSAAPEIVIAANMDDKAIPQAVRDHNNGQLSQGAQGQPEGFFYGGKVYLIADQLATPKDVMRVLFHETLGHVGLRGAFGESLTPILKQIAMFRPAETMQRAINEGFTPKNLPKDYTVKQFMDALPEDKKLRAAEEVLAYWAQTKPEMGFVKRAIAAIRTWLRAHGVNLQLSDSDIVANYILPARAFVESGKGAAAGDTAFSRQAQTDTPAFKAWFGDSKVVDAEGKPMVVYHGTAGEVTVFEPYWKQLERNATPYELKGNGDIAKLYRMAKDESELHFFAEEENTAQTYGSDVVQAFLKVERPVFSESREDAIERMLEADVDGARFPDTTSGGRYGGYAWVVRNSTQIKSATGNNGNFDASNPDIRFSRSIGDTLKAVTVTDIKAKAGNKLADYRNLGLQFLGGRQLADLYGDDIPQIDSYTKMVQQMSADTNEVGAQADAIVTSWAKLADERQLAELMHDATLMQIDPAKDYVDGDNRMQWGKLNAQFKALTPEAKKIFTEARDSYEEHYSRVREAIQEKIERSAMGKESKARMLERMDGEFFDKIKGVYFPLARFGKYVVVTRDGAGNVVNVSRAETLNEAEALRKDMQTAYPRNSGYAVGKVLKDKEFNASRDAVGRGFLKELFGVLDQQGVGDQLQDAVNQLYLASMPDLSWAKHGIHRKGTPGFSQDARRAYAQNMFHGARYLAKLRFADQLQDKLTAMQDHVDAQKEDESVDSVKGQQIVDEYVARHDSLMNPKSSPLSTALTSFGFVFHMGLSPASAMVNLSGTALVAYPMMGAKWGFNKAAGALLMASKQAAANKNDISKALSKDEKLAYDAAVKAGTIDVTAAHDLAGIAQGEDAGVMWKIRPVMKWASFMFHHAERFNRQVTFVASYRLARGAGVNHEAAFEQATKATYDTHFDYSASNRPRIMQGNIARVALLFKQYGQNMIYTLTRQAQLAMNAETPQGRAEARKALGGLLVMHASAAGVLGLPLVGPLLAAASMLGGSDDEPWDAETALRNMLADTFGQKPAEVMAKGFSRLTPWDLSGRVGLNHLILPDIQEGLEGQRLGESAMAAALGPVAGIGINILKGMQEISEGHVARGYETMMPVALRSPMKALRYELEGAKDKTGVMIQDEVSAAGVAGQALGFSPSDVRNATEGRSAIFKADSMLMQRRKELMSQYARAATEKDAEAMAEVREAIKNFNDINPNRRISNMNMLQSVKNKAKRVEEAKSGVFLPKKRREVLEEGRFAE